MQSIDLDQKRRSRIFGVGAIFALLVVASALAGGLLVPQKAVHAAGPSDWENELLRLTNVDRTSNGVGALMPEGQLSTIARERSDDMIQRQYFSHDIPGGGNVGGMIDQQGIGYLSWGENIGYASGHDDDVVSYLEQRWMASPGHRANILNATFTHFGPGAVVGTYKSVPDVKMFTELFLQPDGSAEPSTLPPAPQQTAPKTSQAAAPADSRTFAETGKTVRGLFLSYWNNSGGTNIQGLPISDEMTEKSDLDGNTYKVQYFERAVFEYHPENQAPYNVLLSQLGTFLYQKKYGANPPGQRANTSGQLVSETGHYVGGKFLQYWQSHGGVAQLGYPISDEFTEVSALDGKPYTVQYFERAVMELHPENQAPYDVLLSQLGTFQYRQKYGQ